MASPRAMLRRWPTWSSLLGFTEVCSTRTTPGRLGKGALGRRASRRRASVRRRKFRYPPTGTASSTNSGRGSRSLSSWAMAWGLPQLLGQGEKGDAVVPRFVLGGPGHLEADRNPHLL